MALRSVLKESFKGPAFAALVAVHVVEIHNQTTIARSRRFTNMLRVIRLLCLSRNLIKSLEWLRFRAGAYRPELAGKAAGFGQILRPLLVTYQDARQSTTRSTGRESPAFA